MNGAQDDTIYPEASRFYGLERREENCLLSRYISSLGAIIIYGESMRLGIRVDYRDLDNVATVHAYDRPSLSDVIGAIVVAAIACNYGNITDCTRDPRTRGTGNPDGVCNGSTTQCDR